MIIRKSIQETTGNESNVTQSFKQNIFYFVKEASSKPFIFDTPQYTTIGGTTDYYGQNDNSIFTSLVKPFIRFNFTENTDSFGDDVYIKHDIYRVTWDTFSAAQKIFKIDSQEEREEEADSVEIIEEADEITGEVLSRKRVTRSLSEKKSSQNYIKQKNGFERLENRDLERPPVSRVDLMNEIQNQLNEPIFSILVPTKSIAGDIYDLQIEQYIKNLGDLKTELFQDKNQYIVDTNFVFNIERTPNLTDYKILIDNQVVDAEYKSVDTGYTFSDEIEVEEGDFSGLRFKKGEYFSYFLVPDKPVFEYPTPTGQTNTFTPEIFWSNGEGADSYVVQVNYNTGDTSFTGTVFTYVIPKTDEYKQASKASITHGNENFSSDKTIRKFQLSLKSNKCALFRVGNVKEIINIFGVRQSVVTFSDNKQICTQQEPIKTFVYSESDSPYKKEISNLRTPPSLESETPEETYSINGLITEPPNTEGISIQLIFPNSNFITTTTNEHGEFVFEDIPEGSYTLNVTYRGYVSKTRDITITEDKNISVELEMLWDNDFDIWGDREDDIIKY